MSQISDTSLRRWTVESNSLKCSDGVVIPHVSSIPAGKWFDDVREWPKVHYFDIFNYFVSSVGIDGEAMKNYKSMESYQFFQSFKVGQVLHHEVASDLLYLKADVIPSQSVKAAKYEAWVLVKKTGEIETAGCGCIAGKGKTCSHAGAILWKMEYAASTGRTGLSCTDIQQGWNKGTSKNLEPRQLQEIDFRKKKRTSKLVDGVPALASSNMCKLPSYLTSAEFKAAVEKSSVAELFKFGLANKVLTANCSSLGQPIPVVEHSEHSTESAVGCNMCSSFYHKYIFLDSKQIAALEEETRDQAASCIWRDARKLRISASVAKKVPVREDTNADSFLREQLYPSFKGNANTRYGQSSEPKALEELKKLGYDIRNHGSFVSSTEPWLSASPDGITTDGAIVEIKCPVISNGAPGFQDGVCDTYTINEKIQLKVNGQRGYYKQVQITMYCTGRRACKFFVWNADHHILLDVAYDEHFINQEVKRLKKFYFTRMLPRLATDFQDGRLKVGSAYRRLCSK